jgi:hypothetical protein
LKLSRNRYCPELGKSRMYELLAIKDGRATIEEIRAATRKRVAKHRAAEKDVTEKDSVTSEIPNVGSRTDTKGRKQPAKKSKPDTATESTRQEILNPTAEESAAERKAVYAAAEPSQGECPDCETEQDFWERSFGNLAGDAISMRAFWKRQFGDWEKFEVTSELVTLAEQAAEAWTKLAASIKARA